MTPLVAALGLVLLGLAWRPAVLRRAWPAVHRQAAIAAGSLGGLGLLLGDPAGALLLAAGGGGTVELALRRRARRDAAAAADGLLRDLPDALELLAAAVDGGAPLARSLEAVALHAPPPLGPVLAAAAAEAYEVGGPPLGRAIAERHAVLRPLGAIVAQSDELGTPLAPALRLLAGDERARRRSAARERAAAAAPRMMLVVGLVLAPAALLLIVGAQALTLVDALGSGGRP